MDVPEFVHPLALDFEYEGREITLSPVAIETERGLLLLDVGPPSTTDQLLATLDTAGFSASEIALILATHQDSDHVGGLSSVVEASAPVSSAVETSDPAVEPSEPTVETSEPTVEASDPAPSVVEASTPTVVAHERAAPMVDGRTSPRGSDDESRYPPQRVDIELAGEATFHTRAGPARVIPTPGHTPGHVSVWLPDEQFLIAADALTADEDRLTGPRPDMSEDVELARASLERLAELNVERTFCYHGGFVAEGSDRIAELSQQ